MDTSKYVIREKPANELVEPSRSTDTINRSFLRYSTSSNYKVYMEYTGLCMLKAGTPERRNARTPEC